jgi:hypothetical protein
VLPAALQKSTFEQQNWGIPSVGYLQHWNPGIFLLGKGHLVGIDLGGVTAGFDV